MNTKEFSPAKLFISIPKLNMVLIYNFIFLCMMPGTLTEAEGRRHKCNRNARDQQQSHKQLLQPSFKYFKSHSLTYEDKAEYSGMMLKECVCK